MICDKFKMNSYEHLNWVQGSKKALRDKLYSSENTQGRVILVGILISDILIDGFLLIRVLLSGH